MFGMRPLSCMTVVVVVVVLKLPSDRFPRVILVIDCRGQDLYIDEAWSALCLGDVCHQTITIKPLTFETISAVTPFKQLQENTGRTVRLTAFILYVQLVGRKTHIHGCGGLYWADQSPKSTTVVVCTGLIRALNPRLWLSVLG